MDLGGALVGAGTSLTEADLAAEAERYKADQQRRAAIAAAAVSGGMDILNLFS